MTLTPLEPTEPQYVMQLLPGHVAARTVHEPAPFQIAGLFKFRALLGRTGSRLTDVVAAGAVVTVLESEPA